MSVYARRRSIPHTLSFGDIQAFWNSRASDFDSYLKNAGTADPDLGHSQIELRVWERLLARTVGPAGSRVLDVGTGTGDLSLLMARLGYEVSAVDAAPGMLAITEQNAKRAGLTVRLAEARADALPHQDGAFDAVTSKLLLWTLLEPEVCVREWSRCVRPGGKIVSIDSAHQFRAGVFGQARRAVANARLVKRSGYGYHNEISQVQQLPLWPIRDATPYRNVFIRAGLDRVLVEDLEALTLLRRRRHKLASKLLWPPGHRYLIEGVVPGGQ